MGPCSTMKGPQWRPIWACWGRICYKIAPISQSSTVKEPKCQKPSTVVNRQAPREKTREKILKLILEDASISIKEMSNRIGITQKGIEWQIMRLKKDSFLSFFSHSFFSGFQSYFIFAVYIFCMYKSRVYYFLGRVILFYQ